MPRQSHPCPWWCCFTFDNPFRRLLHDPAAILSPYVREGFTVIDIGPGMGYFTVEMCRLVGEKGKVIAVDIQQKMLDGVQKRALRANVAHQLKTHLTSKENIGPIDKADFVLAFWMMHEVPDRRRFLRQIAELLKPKAQFLLAEPYLHVSKKAFSVTVQTAAEVGLKVEATPKISFSRTALFSSDAVDSS